MELATGIDDKLKAFLEGSKFASQGGIITDLDGTALHEDNGRIYIPKPVEEGFKQIHDLGRPFVLNTLRFPLSVLRNFGKDWYSVSNSPIPTVTLNGSLLGYVTQGQNDEMAFEEIAAYPLAAGEIDAVLQSVRQLVDSGFKNLLLFYYPRDWRSGETIWTPVPDKVLEVKAKYASASSVSAVELRKLSDQLHAEDICMMFLLVDATEEQLMAYQQTRRSNFFNNKGVDKLFGAQRMADALHFDLSSSMGAGDAEFDRFLSGVGLAIIVGHLELSFKGLTDTVRLNDSFELGEFLFRAANMLRKKA